MAQQQQPNIFNLFFGGNKQPLSSPPQQQPIKKSSTIQLKPVEQSQDLVGKFQKRITQLEKEITQCDAQIKKFETDAVTLVRSGQKRQAIEKSGQIKSLNIDKRDKELIRNQLREEIRKLQRTQAAQETYQLKKEAHEYKRTITTEMDVLDIKEMTENDIGVNGEIDYIFDSITGVNEIDEDAENEANEAYLNELMENANSNNNEYIEKPTHTRNNNTINNMMRF